MQRRSVGRPFLNEKNEMAQEIGFCDVKTGVSSFLSPYVLPMMITPHENIHTKKMTDRDELETLFVGDTSIQFTNYSVE